MSLILGWLGLSVGTLALIAAVWFLGPTAIWAFLSTKIGRIILACVAVFALSLGIGQTFYNKAKRECAAANKQREIEIAQRDVKIGELQAKESERLAAEQSRTEDIDNVVQTKLEAELAKRNPADRCELSGPDAQRLR